MDGAVYMAEEIRIHTPAEHTVDGTLYDMEIQIIHSGASQGDLAKSAVLCFLIEKVPGIYNKFIDDLDFFNLPSSLIKTKNLDQSLYIPKIFYEADDLETGAMKPFSFYSYQGSLTSPPCTEETIVYVASKPVRLGSTAIKLFSEALRMPDLISEAGEIISSRPATASNRRVQNTYGRTVFFYDHEKYCGADPPKKKEKNKGHYERIVKPTNDYFYVSGSEPSGMPGSFLVNESEAKGNFK